MYDYPIGVLANCFRLPLDESLDKALAMGVKGIQLNVAYSEYSPDKMSAEVRRDLLKKVRDRGLVFTALCGDFGRRFDRPEINPDTIEKTKRILDLAKDLETGVVTSHIGVIPPDREHPRYQITRDAVGEIGEYAHEIGVTYAVETGPELSVVLKNFLDDLHCPGLGINLDPANLVMVAGDDPVRAVHNLKDYIVHTHAKDGRMVQQILPEWVYGVYPRPAETLPLTFFEEVPLGTGSVDYHAYLRALDEIGYRGFLTIEREVGEEPAKDIATAIEFLRKNLR